MPKCKECKDKFIVKYFNQKYCMEKDECIKAFVEATKENQKKLEEKKWRQEKKETIERLKRPQEYKNDLQKIFNEFIRLRDKGEDCISCGCNMENRKGDASHYYAVSIAPNLRFNEDNVHLSCVPCNQYKSGNLIEYGLRLPKRIGQENFDKLLADRHKELKLNNEEVKELIKVYKLKIIELKLK